MDKKLVGFIGLALELPVVILIFVFIGDFCDKHYALKGFGVGAGVLIAFSGWVTHLILLVKKYDSVEEPKK